MSDVYKKGNKDKSNNKRSSAMLVSKYWGSYSKGILQQGGPRARGSYIKGVLQQGVLQQGGPTARGPTD